MRNKIRLIVTARDPSTANDILQILPFFINKKMFNIRIFAQEPAYHILINSEINFNSTFLKIFKCCNTELIQKLKKYLIVQFNKFRPHLLLTGISSPDFGIDEIALDICSKISNVKTFSIQSYWGDLNQSYGAIADTLFVLDDFARKVTKKRSKTSKIIITGPLKTKLYDNFDIINTRNRFRTQYIKDDNKFVVALFGQPLHEYKWYRDTFIKFFAEIDSRFSNISIIFKPHPKETDDSINWMKYKLSNLNVENFIMKDIDSLTLLSGCDVAVSLFSTIGYDLQNLLLRSATPFSIPVYLFYNDECIKWYQEYCKLHTIPMSEKMSLILKSEKNLKNEIKALFSHDLKRKYHKSIKELFHNNKSSAETIIFNTLISFANEIKV